jgi:hypothetical protein
MRWGAAGGHDGLKFGGSTGRSSRSRVIQSRGSMELGPAGTEQTREDGGVSPAVPKVASNRCVSHCSLQLTRDFQLLHLKTIEQQVARDA